MELLNENPGSQQAIDLNDLCTPCTIVQKELGKLCQKYKVVAFPEVLIRGGIIITRINFCTEKEFKNFHNNINPLYV